MREKLLHNNFIKMTAAAVLLLCGVIAGVIFYQRQSSENMLRQLKATLADDVSRQVKSFQMVLDGQYDLLDYFASFYVTRQEIREASELQLRLLVKPTSFYNVGIAFADGRTCSVRNLGIVPQEQAFYKKSLRSERALEWLFVDGEKRLTLSVPLFTDGLIVGVLFGSLREETVRELLSSAEISRKGSTFLCDVSGDILVSNNVNQFTGGSQSGDGHEDNFLKLLCPYLSKEPQVLEQLQGDFMNRRTGVVSYSLNNSLRYAFYTPTNLNDWIAVNEVPMQEIASMLEKSSTYAGMAMLIILIVWGGVFFVLYRNERQHSLKLQKQQELMKIREDEYRIAVHQSGAMLFRF